MRYPLDTIRQLLADQAASHHRVTAFCAERELVVATFYSWRRKYAAPSRPSGEGFCKIVTRPEMRAKTLRLPSGLELELVGLNMTELAELLLQIDRVHA